MNCECCENKFEGMSDKELLEYVENTPDSYIDGGVLLTDELYARLRRAIRGTPITVAHIKDES